MFFALCRFEIHIPQGRSLKGKRSVVNRIRERLRVRFHASVAEVAHQDLHQRATLAVALVGTSPGALESGLGAMRRLVEQEDRCYVTIWETRVEPFEGAPGAPRDHSLAVPGDREPASAWDEIEEDDELFGGVRQPPKGEDANG